MSENQNQKTIEINVRKPEEVEALKAQLAEEHDRAEDLCNKLGIIAEKALEKKRELVTEQINALISGQRKAEMLEQVKTQSGESLKAMEYTMNMLKEQLDKQNSKPQPRQEIPSGSAPLNRQQMGGSNDQNIWTRKFSSGEEMVRALESVAGDISNPDSQKAKSALQQIWQKNVAEWKNNGKVTQLIPNRDDSIQKKDGDVEAQEDALGNQLESEVARIVGPKNGKPFGIAQHNYSRTHTQGGQPIEGEKQ